MSNYTLNNVRRFITHIDENNYWDLYLNEDYPGNGGLLPVCEGAYIDTTNEDCISGDELLSLKEYFYEAYCSNGLKLENIGYTGVDNGLITYRKDRISNEQFYKLYTKSTYEIPSGDTRLHLHKVGGNTGKYEYPTSYNEDGSIKLNGGFYQGFFRSGDKYAVLPSRIGVGQEWNLYFDIRRYDYEPESNKTLNNAHPDNRGIFFYIGTRAENKWVYLYDKIPMSGDSYGYCDTDDWASDIMEEDMVLSAQTYDTSNGFDIYSANDDYIISNNKFLLFDRTPYGLTTLTYEGDEVAMLSFKKHRFNGNLFLYLNRSCTGYTIHDIDEIESSGGSETYKDETIYSDISNNALAFVIKDDGSIGYKYLVKSCSGDGESSYDILEGYSYPGIVKYGEWTSVHVRIKGYAKGMKLMFYVDGKLKYITTTLPPLNLHALDELQEKQEGVAYNISIGGGTQGLAETIMPDYMLIPTKVFPLEENFGGSFIGDIKSFKFQYC